jgi:hypothetical protein
MFNSPELVGLIAGQEYENRGAGSGRDISRDSLDFKLSLGLCERVKRDAAGSTA